MTRLVSKKSLTNSIALSLIVSPRLLRELLREELTSPKVLPWNVLLRELMLRGTTLPSISYVTYFRSQGSITNMYVSSRMRGRRKPTTTEHCLDILCHWVGSYRHKLQLELTSVGLCLRMERTGR